MRNLNKPPRYNVASIQAQQTLGGDVMQSHEQGDYVEFRDYQWLLTEKQRLDSLTAEMDKTINASQAECRRLKAEVERLTELNSSLNIRYDTACGAINGSTNYIGQLEEDIERLTKAGDAMANNIPYYADVDISAETLREFTEKWNAAKEGKQS